MSTGSASHRCQDDYCAAPRPGVWEERAQASGFSRGYLSYDGPDDADYAPGARAFVRQLQHMGVPYVWVTRRDHAIVWRYHNWAYWRESAADALERLSALFLAERHQDIITR